MLAPFAEDHQDLSSRHRGLSAREPQCFRKPQAAAVEQAQHGCIARDDPRFRRSRGGNIHRVDGGGGIIDRQRSGCDLGKAGAAQNGKSGVVDETASAQETEKAAHHG